MNKYACFYGSKTIEVESDTTYHAQLEAAKLLKAKKSWAVTVMLVEKDDEVVIHNGGEL